EGNSRKEAAEQLGWPEGTLSSRLARARIMLAKRLERHGLAFSGGLLAVVLSQNAASAAVPSTLASSTTQAACVMAAGETAAACGLISANVAALTEGVLQAMFITKLKIASAVLLVSFALVGVGGGLLSVPRGAEYAGAAEPRDPFFEVAQK